MCEKFGKENIKRQYRDKVRYPFNCDFYIKPLDLFIEYQGDWSHGDIRYKCHEPFNPYNTNHQKVLKIWQELAEKKELENNIENRYRKSIEVWTIRDVNKRNIAKQNNLNYIELWSVKEAEQWIKEFKDAI